MTGESSLTAHALSETVREWLPVATIADLRLLADPGATRYVEVLGYTTKGDGGGGPFYWDDTSTATSNPGTVILPTGQAEGTAGRWLRLNSVGEIVEFSGAGPHALTLAHHGKTVRVTHTSACTLVAPETSTETIELPFTCGIVQGGAGQLTIDVEGSDVLESVDSLVALYGQHSGAVLYKRLAGSPNTYTLVGDLA